MNQPVQLSKKSRRFLDHVTKDHQPPSYAELQAQVRELQEQISTLAQEHEQHLNVVRAERDARDFELINLRSYMDHIVDAFDRDVPSVTKQTAWPCGLFNFGKATQGGQVRYFNPTIIERNGTDYLICRRSVPWPVATIGMNDLVAFALHPENRQPQTGVVVAFPKRYRDEHFEDPRATWINGKLTISCTNFQILTDRRWRGSHQLFATFGEHGWHSQKLFDPIYGNNGGSPYMQKGNEKNWTWFGHEGEIYMVYLLSPHRVVRFNSFIEPQEEWETEQANPIWMHGVLRGGTPPVRVGDEYFAFYHTSTPWIHNKRRYHMGCYAFQAKPPWRITRQTSLPLISGSKEDPWQQGLPLCVFPGGSIFRNDKWLVVFGVNDFTSGWIEIPHVDLLNIMREVKEDDRPQHRMTLTAVNGQPMTPDGKPITA